MVKSDFKAGDDAPFAPSAHCTIARAYLMEQHAEADARDSGRATMADDSYADLANQRLQTVLSKPTGSSARKTT